jgi:hypothetical protein
MTGRKGDFAGDFHPWGNSRPTPDFGLTLLFADIETGK